MKVLDLCCAQDHAFEGWFGSEDDFRSQFERGLVVCPLCGSAEVTRRPSAPRLLIGRAMEPQRTAAPGDPSSAAPSTQVSLPVPGGAPAERFAVLQSQWLRAVQHVMENTVDVGEKFAEEARRIHYGEVEERAIRGRSTPGEAEALREEGIEVMSIPVPESLKRPLQ
jgi:hypothetical protein